MREYLFAPDVVRVMLVIGVIVSIVFYEKVQLTTGGAIVPAYLALALPAPLLVITTLSVGVATWAIVHKYLPRHMILYGRRKFEIEVLVGLGLILILTGIALRLGRIDPLLLGLTGIGYLVPGIIAHDMGRQGPRKTLLAIGANVAILAIAATLVAGILQRVAVNPGDSHIVLAGVLGFPRELIILAAVASVLIGMLVFARLGLRSGGFITGAYLALVAPRWPDLVFVAIAALMTWAVVTKLLMPRLLLFGRRKLATMILVSSIITWSLELLALWISNEQYLPWRGLTIVTLMAPALLANDAERQGIERTLWGASITGMGVFGAMNLLAAAAITLGLL